MSKDPYYVPSLVDLPVLHEPPLSKLERDFIMVAVLVRIQHLRHTEALTLTKALLALGQRTPEVLLAKAVVESALENYEAVLDTIHELDRLDPPEFRPDRKIDERVRVRSFMKARATFGLTGALDNEGRASLDFYLRQSTNKPKAKNRR